MKGPQGPVTVYAGTLYDSTRATKHLIAPWWLFLEKLILSYPYKTIGQSTTEKHELNSFQRR